MQTILKQRRLFVTKEFELGQGVLSVKENRPLKHVETKIGFESISSDVIRKKNPSYWVVLITVLTLANFVYAIYAQYVMAPIHGLFFFICLMILLASYQNDINILLTNGVPLAFFANSPNRAQVKVFIELFLKERKSYLFNRYAVPNVTLTEEQRLANLNWLFQMKVINQAELQELKQNSTINN